MAEDRLDRWEREEVEKRRKRAALAARVEAELPRLPFYPSVGPQWPSFEAWTAEQWRLALDPVENAKAALRAYAAQAGPVEPPLVDPVWERARREWVERERAWAAAVERKQAQLEPVIVWTLEEWRRLYGPKRPPWWARAMAWGIACWYALRSVRGSQRR